MAVFGCSVCGVEVTQAVKSGVVDEPSACPGCQGKWTMRLTHNRCQFRDKQLVKMQVRPRLMPHHDTTWKPQSAVTSNFAEDNIT